MCPRPPSVRWPHATQSSTQQQGRWRQPHRNGRQVQPPPKTGSGHRRFSKLKAALRAVGDDDETAPSLREALKRARQQAVPLSTQDKVTQCESFLERARKRERVGTIERRGCRRGATVGDTSSRGQQRWRGCVLWWSSCRRRRKTVVPKSRPISRPVVSFTVRSSSGGAEGTLGVDGYAERTRCVEGCVGGPTELHGHIRPSFPRHSHVCFDRRCRQEKVPRGIMNRYGLRGVLVGRLLIRAPVAGVLSVQWKAGM